MYNVQCNVLNEWMNSMFLTFKTLNRLTLLTKQTVESLNSSLEYQSEFE